MKKTMMILTLAVISHSAVSFGTVSFVDTIDPEFERRNVEFNGGDVNKIPVREEPGSDAEVVLEEVHSKEIDVLRGDLSFKWTSLGYGAMTHKVIVPQLAAHTLFNHRNPGEDGPCLRSDRRRMGGVDIDFPFPDFEPINPKVPEVPPVDPNEEISIAIKISNRYLMNREKNICKVQMVEDVRTIIAGEEFYHTYTKDMGFRFINDCPEEN